MKFLRPPLFSIFLLLLIAAGAIFFLPHVQQAKASGPQTWFIRPDGGTRYSANVPNGQCDGLADVAYPGSGVDQHCAFNDFRYMWDDDSGVVGAGAWVMAGGDTVVIRGCSALPNQSNASNPDCRLGWDRGDGNSDNNWCRNVGNISCFNPPIPAGTPSDPTRILGACAYGTYTCTPINNNYPYGTTNETQLFGGFGQTWSFNLGSTNNVQIEGIELTTHNGVCTRGGSPGSLRDCEANYQPYDDFAQNGFLTNNATANLTLQDLYIHGFNSSGLFGPIGGSITMTRVFSGFNGFGGWNFADQQDTPDAPGASINANYVTMEGNGCYEQYPIVNTQFPARACYDDGSGGFGDSWSGQDTNLASFTCDHCVQKYNTKDGFIGPHTYINNLVIENSASIGNMGAQWKWDDAPGGNVTFVNNLAVSGCIRMAFQLPGAAQNFALSTGLPGSYLSDFCRAAGNSFALLTQPNSNVLIANNTTITDSDTVFDLDCGPAGGSAGDCQAASIVIKNNIFLGYTNPYSDYPQAPGLFYYTDPSLSISSSYNLEYGIRNGDPCGGTIICSDPLLGGEPPQSYSGDDSTFDNITFVPLLGSPAIGAGNPIPGITTDYNGNARGNPPAIGAVEPGSSGYSSSSSSSSGGGSSSPPPSDTTPPTTSITSPSNNASVSGTITIPVSASDNVGVTSVALYIDGTLRSTDSSSPYSFSLNTTSLSNGTHTIYTKAYDAAGNVGTSGTITFTVTNVVLDTTPPSVPTGLTLGTITASSIAFSWTPSTDNVSVTGYTIYRGGTKIGTSNTASYADTGLSASTPYLYTVSAYDTAGNASAQSSGITGTTSAALGGGSPSSDTTPPTTSVTSPLSGATESGTVSITASASDNVSVTSVALYVDGTLEGTDNASPYAFTLNTATLSNSLHTLYTKAYDAAGNIGTSGNIAFTVSNILGSTPSSPSSGGGSSGGGGGGSGGGGVSPAPSFEITSVSVTDVTQTSADITVTTHVPASIIVKYGKTTLYGTTTGASPLLTTNYENLTNLTPGTIYDFIVVATPLGATPLTSQVYTLETTGASAPGITATPSASVTPAFTENLAYGDTNGEVTLLQTILHSQGFLPGALGITDYFGTQTEHALLLFQAAHDLNKSGFVDVQSEALLNKIAGAQASVKVTPSVQPPTSTLPSPTGSLTQNLAPGSTGTQVTILQHILRADGDYPSAIYSQFYGSLTESAVKLFQARYGIVNYGAPNTTGYGAVGPKTRVKLNAE